MTAAYTGDHRADNGRINRRRQGFRIAGFEYKEITLPDGKQARRHCITINGYDFYGLWSGYALRVECMQRPEFQKQFIGLKITHGKVIPEIEEIVALWDDEDPGGVMDWMTSGLPKTSGDVGVDEGDTGGLVAGVDY